MKRPTRLSAGEKLVLTANRLLDGQIVWRDAFGQWLPQIRHAETYDAESAELALENAKHNAQRDGVVGVYEVAVQDGSAIEPVSVRERIRAHGPTVHPQFATEA
ncbi:DUF2849 domain-containing protein [Gluconobacter wancherniae]|mgnify:FL=1|uniref:DUF2849 domain-containing protein n=1 Tax=Gluconobacter wancherniae NBRC 103581 TaxID=656744 RepID=A0A511B2S4_9PROT|nr:DUF2849 domain-containing protein [Gluconobacter wancherniae]MBF0854834.1 DUF2849 domain-containing protein [Gluconobacter wancherniae]MBS1089520.1 DUF2849 domain-containing protein [Gluconobacter wancherniae]MBS1095620.1 DUF2849 domain-containing protein [Gluconobacter wancherniae]GBD58001.1 hypothetical protein NBRC103581_02602 [Gluconobacter wancherniae NBRC 103581]GBR65641.1 hypothetical protein AA103581_1934 [Gluconobacter wancherniae NBRC 103581]